MKTIDPKEISVGELHGYLLGAIGPRPIAFASTMNEKGEPNLAPFSFFNVFSANPPIAIFSPARRGRNNTTKHTFENVKRVKEVVINIVNYDLVQQCSLASTEYAEGVNEFEKAGLTPIASDLVKPFRVKESPVQLECIVKEVIELGTEGGAGNLVISEIVKIHVSEAVLDENGKIDPTKIDLVGRMGGNYYARAHGSALFEVTKPLTTLGVGVDAIPADIKNSHFLSGNDLGQLGNVQQLPDETTVNEYRLIELSDLFMTFEDDAKKLEQELHKKAKSLIAEGNIADAWKTLLSFNN
ncbi:MAG: flavin reductase (DIM6/NTAB) family NADH-FMN oxidoreductase RutF [Flavobacteriales bacterium]|jgi:flavin reductase (DIM6/NTAB) family NADH-FMN oxidoreductase RutF